MYNVYTYIMYICSVYIYNIVCYMIYRIVNSYICVYELSLKHFWRLKRRLFKDDNRHAFPLGACLCLSLPCLLPLRRASSVVLAPKSQGPFFVSLTCFLSLRPQPAHFYQLCNFLNTLSLIIRKKHTLNFNANVIMSFILTGL